jgi:hypothetical protein
MRVLKCKDCENQTDNGDDDPALVRSGWSYRNIVSEDENDPLNGWRCPDCNKGWEIVVNEQRGELQSRERGPNGQIDQSSI